MRGGQVLEQLDRQFRFPGIEFLLPLLYQDPAPQTLFDYLPKATPCLLHDPVAIQGKVELVWGSNPGQLPGGGSRQGGSGS